MIHPKIILHGMDQGGAVLLGAVLEAYLLERPPPTTMPPLMMMGCPLIPPFLKGPLAGGMGAKEVKVARVVVTLMELTPLEGGKRKRMDF